MMFNRNQAKFLRGLCLSSLLLGAASLAQADPLSSNNGMYPKPGDGTVFAPDIYSGAYNVANLDYPEELPDADWPPKNRLFGPLNKDNAEDYMNGLKDHIAPTMRILIEDAQNWDAAEANWYNIVWRGAGEPGNPLSGREAIMNTNRGQIVPSNSWSEGHRPTTDWVQNYGVIYYNERAAYTLGQVWEDLYEPKLSRMNFNDGSIVVKVEAATVRPEQWPWDDPASGGSVLNDAAEWQVYRPTTEDQKAYQRDPSFTLINQVQTVYPFQLAIKVKDSVAAPDTGWVFMGFVYDATSDGATVWDRFVPAGMMWGNDPNLTDDPSGLPDGKELQETWVNDEAPEFVRDTLGWGGRMAAPMDVAVRHQVVLPDGSWYTREKRFNASSCLSCHGTAQFPFTANLYPSPNLVFPPDGMPFPMYQPGSLKWAEWFQNRPGNEPQTKSLKIKALDYDLNTMMALGEWAGKTGRDEVAFEVFDGH